MRLALTSVGDGIPGRVPIVLNARLDQQLVVFDHLGKVFVVVGTFYPVTGVMDASSSDIATRVLYPQGCPRYLEPLLVREELGGDNLGVGFDHEWLETAQRLINEHNVVAQDFLCGPEVDRQRDVVRVNCRFSSV